MTHPPVDTNLGPRTTAFERPPSPPSLDAYADHSARHATSATRAIIASALRLLRDGLADALVRSTTIGVATTVGNADQARAAINECTPDVLLLDIEMPGSLALVQAIHDAPRAPKVVAFAVSDADDALVEYIEAGISGYVTRDGSLSEIVATVESVGRGETIVSPRIAASLFQRLAEQRRRHAAVATAAPAQLTSREAQILGLIEQGMANKEIAHTLGIELATVKNHVHHVLEKLKVARRGQAAARARATAHEHGA